MSLPATHTTAFTSPAVVYTSTHGSHGQKMIATPPHTSNVCAYFMWVAIIPISMVCYCDSKIDPIATQTEVNLLIRLFQTQWLISPVSISNSSKQLTHGANQNFRQGLLNISGNQQSPHEFVRLLAPYENKYPFVLLISKHMRKFWTLACFSR